jgi:hypothetical protein
MTAGGCRLHQTENIRMFEALSAVQNLGGANLDHKFVLLNGRQLLHYRVFLRRQEHGHRKAVNWKHFQGHSHLENSRKRNRKRNLLQNFLSQQFYFYVYILKTQRCKISLFNGLPKITISHKFE